MKEISPTIRELLSVLAVTTDNLLSLSEAEILKKFSKLEKAKKADPSELISQLPEGLYSRLSDITSFISRSRKRNEITSIYTSPLVMGYKEFECCKVMKYTGGHIITGRDQEIDKILLTLCKKHKRGVILTGEAGTGKTAIVNAVNARLIERNVPRQLVGAQIYIMDVPYIFSKFKDDPVGHIVKVLERACEYDKAILFVDEVHQLLNQRMNDILKPYLTEQIRFIGSTTTSEFHEIVTNDQALERRFTVIHVEEPTVEQTTNMLIGTKQVFEEAHKCVVSNEICKYAVENGSRFLGHRKNPDKSLDVLDIACAILGEKEPKSVYVEQPLTGDFLTDLSKPVNEIKTLSLVPGNRQLTTDYVDLSISSLTGIEFGKVKHSLNYGHISKTLKEEIIGQDQPIESLANIANIIRCTKGNRIRPIAVLLLVGPTGVGKKLTCSKLVECIYGDNMLVECDMSGLVSEFAITELRGAPPGYVGYGKSGWLIKAIRNHPQSLVYFRQMNKAHQTIQQYVIQSCRSGKMMDSAEREAALNNTIIIYSATLTDEEYGNLTSQKEKILGFSKPTDKRDEPEEKTKKALKGIIGADLVDSADEIIIFNKLSEQNLSDIYDRNISSYLDSYNSVDIDLVSLKKEVLDGTKNAKDLMSKMNSMVPQKIFRSFLKGGEDGNKDSEDYKVKVSRKRAKDRAGRTSEGSCGA